MYNIQTLNNIAPEGLKVFKPEKYNISTDCKDPDGIMVRSKPIHDMEFGKNLKIIARTGAGVNNIPIERCTKEGICVVNAPGGNANAVKEFTVAAMIMLMRNGYEAMTWVKNLPDEDTKYGSKTVENGKEAFPIIAGTLITTSVIRSSSPARATACAPPWLSPSRTMVFPSHAGSVVI